MLLLCKSTRFHIPTHKHCLPSALISCSEANVILSGYNNTVWQNALSWGILLIFDYPIGLFSPNRVSKLIKLSLLHVKEKKIFLVVTSGWLTQFNSLKKEKKIRYPNKWDCYVFIHTYADCFFNCKYLEYFNYTAATQGNKESGILTSRLEQSVRGNPKERNESVACRGAVTI